MAILINEQIYVTNQELLGWGFSSDTISKFSKERSLEDAREYIYSYDKIAQRSEKTKAKLPEKELIMAQINAENAIKDAEKCHVSTGFVYRNFCKFLKISDLHFFKHKKYSEAKSRGLMNSMAMLRFLAATKLKKEDLKAVTGFESRELLLKSTIELFKDEEVNGHIVRKALDLPLLPSSYDRLRRKVDAFVKFRANGKVNECEFLCSKVGNTNSMIIGKPSGTMDDDLIEGTHINVAEFHAATLIKLAMNPGRGNKFDLLEIWNRYARKCKEQGKEPATYAAAKNFLAKPEVKQFYVWERHGFAELDKMLPHIHGKRAEYSLRKGGMDGFQVDFYTQDRDKAVMLTCVAVFDYASEAITGFEVGYVENGLTVRNAYRNHLRLHGGRTYNMLDMDGSMANTSDKTREMFAKVVGRVVVGMGDDPTGKHRANSKSRFSERLIQEVNRLAQSLPEWKGTNVTSFNIARKPNPDYAKKYKATIDQGVAQIIALVNVYNNKPLEKYGSKSRIQVFHEKMDVAAEVIDYTAMAQVFNWSTVVSVRHDVIKIQMHKVDYEYYVPDRLAWASKMEAGSRVKVYYDEGDMSEVHVFGWVVNNEGDPQEHFLGSLKRGERAYRDEASQSNKDLALIGEQTHKRKVMIDRVQRKALEVEAYTYGIDIAQFPNLKDLEMAVKGAREREREETLEERYSEELATDEAVRTQKFYEEHFAQQNIRVREDGNEHQSADMIEKKLKAYGLKK